MAPLTEAVRTSFLEERGGTRVYCGDVDKEWTYISVPQGGYALGLLVDACVSSQAACTQQGEIAHLSAHFYRTTAVGYAEIHVRTMRRGAVYANIAAELVQKDVVKITAQLIFKAPSVDAGPHLSLLVPSPYARRVPLHVHPSAARLTPMLSSARFKASVRWAEDTALRARNRAVGRGEGVAGGGAGLEWGAWVELVDPAERIGVALLPFMGDMMKSIPELLPREERPSSGWHPTMVFALEYKAEIPKNAGFARRTVGLYASGRFMHGGQHDAYVEIWTAPAEIGEGEEVKGWREKQVCLGIAQQMALWVPSAVNEQKAAWANGRL